MRHRLALLTLTAVLAVACGGDAEEGAAPATEDTATTTPAPTTEAAGGQTTVAPPASEAPATTAAPATGATAQAAPETPEILAFTAQGVDGEPFDAARLAGDDVVFWFWAPWCTTCAAATEDVAAVAASSEGVTFVGVGGLSSDADSMVGFVDDHGVDGFTHLADTTGDIYTRFGVIQQHTFAFVDDTGAVETVAAYGRDVDLPALIDEMFG